MWLFFQKQCNIHRLLCHVETWHELARNENSTDWFTGRFKKKSLGVSLRHAETISQYPERLNSNRDYLITNTLTKCQKTSLFKELLHTKSCENIKNFRKCPVL